ncbi:MAG: diguanylate cyclase [bacterium]
MGPLPQQDDDQLFRLIYRDDLTGLYNRRHLAHRFKKPSNEGPDPAPYCLLFMDVDFFKEINDTHGHHAGDTVLIRVAASLTGIGDPQMEAIRYAGDEFILLLHGAPGEHGLARAWEIVERGRALAVPMEGGEPIGVTFSVGVAAFPEHGTGWEEVLEKADHALYQAKQQGRDRASLPPADGGPICRGDDLSRIFPCPRWIGREEETERTAEHFACWQQAAADPDDPARYSILLCTGPAGIGKTRFLEEIRTKLPSWGNVRTLVLSGSEELAGLRFGSLTKCLMDHFGCPDSLRETAGLRLSAEEENAWASLFSRNGECSGDSFDPDSAARLLGRVLGGLAAKQPLAFLVDDPEMADPDTLRFLGLARGAKGPAIPAWVLAAYSERAAAELPGHTAIRLRRFDREAVREMVQAIFPTLRVDASFCEELRTRSQGNPQFLEEALKLLVQEGGLAYVRSAWRWKGEDLSGVPADIEALVRKRLARLDPSVRSLLEKAAAAGSEIDPTLIREIEATNEGHILDLLNRGRKLGLLKARTRWADDGLRFLNRTARNLSYEGVPEEDRIAWHLRMAKAQQARGESPDLNQLGLLIYHARMAGLEDELAKLGKRLIPAPQQAALRVPDKLLKRTKNKTPPAEDVPVPPESLTRVPGLFHLLRAALQNLRLYPEASQAVTTSCERLHQGMEAVLSRIESIHFSEAEGTLLVNGEPPPWKGKESAAGTSFCALLTEAGLKDLWLRRGLTMEELRVLLRTWHEITRNPGSPESSWEALQNREWIEHVQVNGRIYVALSDPQDLGSVLQPVPPGDGERSSRGEDPASLLAFLQARIPAIERFLPKEPDRPPELRELLALLRRAADTLAALQASALPAAETDGGSVCAAPRATADAPALEPAAEKVAEPNVAACLSDVVSGEPAREARGYACLAQMGKRSLESLHYFLGHSDDVRAGRLCAHLLKSLDPDCAARLRADIQGRADPQVKVRVLRCGGAAVEPASWRAILGTALRDEEAAVAREALHQLETGFAGEANPMLLEALPLCPERTRQEICAALGRLGDPKSLPHLIRCLEPNGRRREGGTTRFLEEVCHALGRFDAPEARTQLVRLLACSGRWPWRRRWPAALREAAVRALEKMSREAVLPILKAYENDRDPGVRYRVRKYLQGPPSADEDAAPADPDPA